jgi:dTDP-4-dehydro-6-deoxy-alpha-D-glucopyranose 2,3-dehydratase
MVAQNLARTGGQPTDPYSVGPDAVRLSRSAATLDSPILPQREFAAWFEERRRRHTYQVRRIPFTALDRWGFDPATGNLGHESGRFFTVEGIAVEGGRGPVPGWTQPIIRQPEVGMLGILVKEFDGVLHCLMQFKMEPGNPNLVQLSPTVQATRSNFTRVHRGAPVKYLEYFARPGHRGRVLADVLQSEQGSWFLHKRNRNVVIETTEDVPLDDDYCWLTLGQLRLLLAADELVNMDSRTVLSCLPFAVPPAVGERPAVESMFRQALLRSLAPDAGAEHTMTELLSWITNAKAGSEARVRRIALDDVPDWYRTGTEIAHAGGLHFEVVAVEVEASNREVLRWSQPLLRPVESGVAAFFAARRNGVLHVLVNARAEPGFVDRIELAPTVQCQPGTYAGRSPADRPRYLDQLLAAAPEQVRYRAVHSEEGGRFLNARTTYSVVEVDDSLPAPPDDFRWMTVRQLGDLVRHSGYLDVQARTLLACLHALW